MNERPGPYVPLSRSFATGRTGTAILQRFGAEGIGVWAMMMAAADRGLIVFQHESDWSAIGAEINPPEFTLKEFLTFLGQRKQTRRTQHGRVTYVQLTRWEDWNNTRKREVERLRKSRNRGKSERDIKRDSSGTRTGQVRDPELEADTDSKPRAVNVVPTTARESEPEWPAEDEEQPWDLNMPEIREIA